MEALRVLRGFLKVSPDKILGSSLSSAGGFARIKAEITTPREQQNQGGGCGV
ncbi:MAG: hypothetical protein AAB642_02285 [Patescibacteria group bacterium]